MRAWVSGLARRQRLSCPSPSKSRLQEVDCTRPDTIRLPSVRTETPYRAEPHTLPTAIVDESSIAFSGRVALVARMPRRLPIPWIDSDSNLHWYDPETGYDRGSYDDDQGTSYKKTPNSKGHSVRFSGPTRGGSSTSSDRGRGRRRRRGDHPESRALSAVFSGVYPRDRRHRNLESRSGISIGGPFYDEDHDRWDYDFGRSSGPPRLEDCPHGEVEVVCEYCNDGHGRHAMLATLTTTSTTSAQRLDTNTAGPPQADVDAAVLVRLGAIWVAIAATAPAASSPCTTVWFYMISGIILTSFMITMTTLIMIMILATATPMGGAGEEEEEEDQ
ncbi:uncharacterized protein Z519_08453 [Cladophialophora bantiana CBS 173.52]|uniref:Uncharacterized protein n=1 Tax=Cladophialophora bantiana (strain ATCC 10958 / CBS 173.52 / CDC B-1940 / NIH 8579) TaxID=1442370 RepID=A0A0D2HIU2_CLAB1|nr:uncharacterized protein Z519_08453 [Cladophialophora bantiana CBS 173.52]KIW90670.1 hypothetical protein Z519_08453 [Cladophialophora bantiana CBS 173.52]